MILLMRVIAKLLLSKDFLSLLTGKTETLLLRLVMFPSAYKVKTFAENRRRSVAEDSDTFRDPYMYSKVPFY